MAEVRLQFLESFAERTAAEWTVWLHFGWVFLLFLRFFLFLLILFRLFFLMVLLLILWLLINLMLILLALVILMLIILLLLFIVALVLIVLLIILLTLQLIILSPIQLLLIRLLPVALLLPERKHVLGEDAPDDPPSSVHGREGTHQSLAVVRGSVAAHLDTRDSIALVAPYFNGESVRGAIGNEQ